MCYLLPPPMFVDFLTLPPFLNFLHPCICLQYSPQSPKSSPWHWLQSQHSYLFRCWNSESSFLSKGLSFSPKPYFITSALLLICSSCVILIESIPGTNIPAVGTISIPQAPVFPNFMNIVILILLSYHPLENINYKIELSANTVVALFGFLLGSLRYGDVYKHESGWYHTLPFFLTFFIISSFQVFLLY